MRVLITCIPQTGHITPLLPLAQALVAQGDDVVLATGPDAADAAASAGLTYRPAGPAFADWYGVLRARTRGVPGDGLRPERVEGYFLPRLFGEVGLPAMIDDLLDVARAFEPELLVFDPLAFAGPLVCAELGVAGVHHTVGPVLDPGVLALVADAVSPVWREFGHNVPPSAGVYSGATITICPPSLDPAADGVPDALPLRPVAPPIPQPRPLPVPRRHPERPLLYLTLGTFSNTNLGLFRLVLDALQHEPVEVVATVGRDNDPGALAPVPGNAVVERFVPQAELLPHCAAAVHHAGAGTAFGVLAHGLPSVALPQSADNFTIAARLDSAGVARVLMPDEVSVEAVRDAVAVVLADRGGRDRAAAMAGEIAAMPSPADVASLLRSGTVADGLDFKSA